MESTTKTLHAVRRGACARHYRGGLRSMLRSISHMCTAGVPDSTILAAVVDEAQSLLNNEPPTKLVPMCGNQVGLANSIIAKVSEYYGVHVDTLKSDKYGGVVTIARHHALALAYMHTGLTMRDVAGLLCKSASVVHHAVLDIGDISSELLELVEEELENERE